MMSSGITVINTFIQTWYCEVKMVTKRILYFTKIIGNKKGLTPYRENCQIILLMTVPIMRRLRRLGIKCKFMYYTMYIPTYL